MNRLVKILVAIALITIFSFSIIDVIIHINLTKANEEMTKCVSFVKESLTLADYDSDKAREKLGDAKNSSLLLEDYIYKIENISRVDVKPYKVSANYINNLIACIEEITFIIPLSKEGKPKEVIEHISRFQGFLSKAENSNTQLKESYPEFIEKLGIEDTEASLKAIELDSIDYKNEFEQKNVTIPSPITMRGYIKEYQWIDHLGEERKLMIKISERRLSFYKNLPHSVFYDVDPRNFITCEDNLIKEITQWFFNRYGQESELERDFGILSFVSQSIPNIPESEGEDYWKYPVETLLEGGNCEDKANLLTTLCNAYVKLEEKEAGSAEWYSTAIIYIS